MEGSFDSSDSWSLSQATAKRAGRPRPGSAWPQQGSPDDAKWGASRRTQPRRPLRSKARSPSALPRAPNQQPHAHTCLSGAQHASSTRTPPQPSPAEAANPRTAPSSESLLEQGEREGSRLEQGRGPGPRAWWAVSRGIPVAAVQSLRAPREQPARCRRWRITLPIVMIHLLAWASFRLPIPRARSVVDTASRERAAFARRHCGAFSPCHSAPTSQYCDRAAAEACMHAHPRCCSPGTGQAFWRCAPGQAPAPSAGSLSKTAVFVSPFPRLLPDQLLGTPARKLLHYCCCALLLTDLFPCRAENKLHRVARIIR